MRLFRKCGHVCQNCAHSNNEKGKWKHRRFQFNWEKGYWYVFCEKKKKFRTWDRFKRCFEHILPIGVFYDES